MVSPIGIEVRKVGTMCLVAALVAGARPAWAEPSDQDRAVAQSLFDRGRTLAENGRFSDACPLFEESQRLDPGAGTQLNLALCYEGDQRLAKAYGLLNEALSVAIKDGRTDRRAIAEEHLAAIGPRLSMLTVMVPDESRVPELILWLDGEKISSASAGVPIAVDGGTHKVEATARKHHPFSTDVDVKPERDRVTVTIPRLVPHAEAAVSEGPVPITEPHVATHSPPPPKQETKERTAAAWGLGAAGLGLSIIGTATGIVALVRNGEAKDLALSQGCNFARSYCPKGTTPTDAISKSQEATALGWTSTISLAVGVSAFVVALALPKHKVERPAPKAGAVELTAVPYGLGLGGVF